MPHEWRLPARSAVSPRACATDSSPEIPSAIAGAFADRTPIDWTALLDRIRDPRGPVSLHALPRPAELRARPRGCALPPAHDRRDIAPGLLVGVGALQT